MVKTTVDLISSVLRRCGEVQDGTSLYATQALDYLNQIHQTVITGGSEFNLEVDEPWVWARARRPIVIELQPYYSTGNVTLTLGSTAVTFSVAPTVSLEGYFLKADAGPEIYKIISHTASSTAAVIDAAFPQTTVTGTFKAFLTDYELVSGYIVIDSGNDTLDFIESGTTVITATITHGSYTPAALATLIASTLNAAGTHGNTYSAAYDTNTRLFSVTSALNGTGTPIFKPQVAGTNSYRSGWTTLGFDMKNYATAGTQTASYPHSTVIRLTEPARCYYGSYFNYGEPQGSVAGIDALTMDRDFPMTAIRIGAPTQFAVIREKNDGTQTVRFNRYSDRKMRIEFEHVPIPRDLQNNTASIPLIPNKFIRILEYGAAFYILTDKRDSKADKYYQIAQQTLSAMMKFNRKELQRVGRNFGNVIARPDLMPENRRGRINNYGYTAGTE